MWEVLRVGNARCPSRVGRWVLEPREVGMVMIWKVAQGAGPALRSGERQEGGSSQKPRNGVVQGRRARDQPGLPP